MKREMDQRDLEAEINRLAIAAKALKLAVEEANRLCGLIANEPSEFS